MIESGGQTDKSEEKAVLLKKEKKERKTVGGEREVLAIQPHHAHCNILAEVGRKIVCSETLPAHATVVDVVFCATNLFSWVMSFPTKK